MTFPGALRGFVKSSAFVKLVSFPLEHSGRQSGFAYGLFTCSPYIAEIVRMHHLQFS